MKRIPDVLSSPEQVKRVLREVCILRRLSHPFIITLLDAFIKPAAQGVLSALRSHRRIMMLLLWKATVQPAAPGPCPISLAQPGSGTCVPAARSPAC